MARYIDVDKFAEKICNFQQIDEDTANKMIFLLHTFPTADVVEVKHSRWENISGFDVCNICGTSPAYCEPKPNNPKGYPPYCHNCGAKMRGDTE